jgi:hypothetical protein
MVFLSEIQKCVIIIFLAQKGLRMLRRMVSSEWRMGDGERTIRHSLIATGRNPGQVLENAQNGKG